MIASPHCCRANRSASRGFTLMEVLVALLVLSIGLLGVAGLQTTSLRLNNDSFNLTQSQLLIDDLTERMRTNWNDGKALARYGSQFADADPTACAVASIGQDDAALKNELSCWLEQVDKTIGLQFAPTFTVFAATDDKAHYADIRLGWHDRELDSQSECNNFSGRVWQAPSVPAGDPTPSPECFVVITWSVSL